MSTGPFTSARLSTASARSSAETSLSEQVRAERAKLLALVIFIVCRMLPRIILVILSDTVVIIVVVFTARRWTPPRRVVDAGRVLVRGFTITVLGYGREMKFPSRARLRYRIGPTVVDELNNGALSVVAATRSATIMEWLSG